MSKPLGIKNYGSIGHLPNSRMGSGDHSVHEGQARICCENSRDKHDIIIVQEKLDGSNVGIAKVSGKILALVRAGYLANTSPFEQHHKFSEWVEKNANRFDSVLNEGERIAGEWLLQAHGTRYDLQHEPFVAFDIMRGTKRVVYDELYSRLNDKFVLPHLISKGAPMAVCDAMAMLGEYGKHGALDKVEGVVYRVERKGEVDFLAKYVRHDKADGIYLESVSGMPTVWNVGR